MATIYNQKPFANETKGTQVFIYERFFLVRYKIYKKIPLESLNDTINPHTAVTKNENVHIFNQKKYMWFQDKIPHGKLPPRS